MAVLCSMKVLVMTLLLLDSTTAQQPSGSQMHMAYPGISDSCGDALNTTVDCPRFISSLSVKSVNYLTSPGLHVSGHRR